MPQNTLDKKNWMSHVLEIGCLKLTDLVWPGAHNCGMDRKPSDHDPVFGHWTVCQNGSFTWQLENGARAFDIRLGYDPAPASPAFYFHHNGYKSGRNLDDLIDAVTAFLDQHPDEFLILDFHQLGDGDKPFGYRQLHERLMQGVGSRLISFEDAHLDVAHLKRASALRRIVVAVPARQELDDLYYWPKIPHKWTGEAFVYPSDLRNLIATSLAQPMQDILWSLSVTGYTFLGGPSHLERHINDWFHSSRGLTTRCSIINSDFFEESDIVNHCWIASSEKAVYGERLRVTV